jgi:hypothetical protein
VQARGGADPNQPRLSFDRYLKGLATGNWDGAPEERALSEGTASAGGHLVPACAAVVRTFDGPVGDDLGQVLALLELGVGDVVAWQALHDHPQLGLAAADLARSVESGTSIVQGLRHHAAAARDVRRSELQVLARAASVRTIRF